MEDDSGVGGGRDKDSREEYDNYCLKTMAVGGGSSGNKDGGAKMMKTI